MDTHGEWGTRVYNGGVGLALPVGSGQSPWSSGQGSKAPFSWKHLSFVCPTETASSPRILQTGESSCICDRLLYCIFIGLKNSLQQKCSGRFHAVAAPVRPCHLFIAKSTAWQQRRSCVSGLHRAELYIVLGENWTWCVLITSPALLIAARSRRFIGH